MRINGITGSRRHAGAHIHRIPNAIINDFTWCRTGDTGFVAGAVIGCAYNKGAAAGNGPGSSQGTLIAVFKGKTKLAFSAGKVTGGHGDTMSGKASVYMSGGQHKCFTNRGTGAIQSQDGPINRGDSETCSDELS